MNLLNAASAGIYPAPPVDPDIYDAVYDYSQAESTLAKVVYGTVLAVTVGYTLLEWWSQVREERAVLEDPRVDQRLHVLQELERERKNLNKQAAPSQNVNKRTEWLRSQTLEAQKRIGRHRHRMFAPGAMEQIGEAIDQARHLAGAGAEQAALSTWYSAYELARNTEKAVLDAEIRWEESCLAYFRRRQELCRMARAAGAFPGVFRTAEGNETAQVDVDYWTGGGVAALIAGLPDGDVAQDCPLEEILCRTARVEQAEGELQTLTDRAVEAFADSQRRMDLCDAVYRSFLDRGWVLDEERPSGFEEDDMRGNICLALESPARDSLRLTFAPEGRVLAEADFHRVYHRGITGYLAGILRQVLEENHVAVAQMTGVT